MKYQQKKKQKIENELKNIEQKIEEMRKKRIELNSKLAAMDVKDYTLRDRDGKDVKLSEMFGKDHRYSFIIWGKDVRTVQCGQTASRTQYIRRLKRRLRLCL